MRSAIGATLLELIVVLSIVGLVAMTVGVARTTSSLSEQAGAIARAVAGARLNAVAAGRVVGATPGPCAGGLEVGSLVGGNVVASWPPRGLLFTPDGLPRTCDGGGVGNTTILLEHRGRQAAVIVSALGRVRWELR